MNTLVIVNLLLAILVPACATAQEVAPYPPPPSDVSSIATITSADEPGERLTITGTVYKTDGKTPYVGMVLYFYQTDADGVYNKTDRSWQRPRLRGWVITDKDGHYTLNTIKPGSYPNGGNPAHIHITAQLPGEQPKWIDAFLFEGDPYLSESDKKSAAGKETFSPIMKTQRDSNGILRARRDMTLH